MKSISRRWARGERGYCGVCVRRFVIRKDDCLTAHTRLVVSGERQRCEGSGTAAVSKAAATRATLEPS